MLNMLLSNPTSVEFGSGAFLALSVYKASLISALGKSLSGGASNIMSSLALLGYAMIQNICDVKCLRLCRLDLTFDV